jgi:hypothetical protein
VNIAPPAELLAALRGFDTRTDIFDCSAIMVEMNKVIEGNAYGDDQHRRSIWAEWAPWEFSWRHTGDGGPWKTYFQPRMMTSNEQGEYRARPDLRTATAEIIAYWGNRAEETKHPVIKSRYADLVWDTTRFVTGKKPNIKYARIAIDSYLAAAQRYTGDEPIRMREGLTRALQLALSVQDKERIAAAVDTTVAFVERTAQDEHEGTYCYLFDSLLPPEKGPVITPDIERRIIGFFEAKLALMTTPGGPRDEQPRGAGEVGLRLAAYYRRTKREPDRVRVLSAVAQAHERRAAIADPMLAMRDLERAGELYVEAGLRDEAERVRREGQEMGPEVAESMEVIETQTEIPNARVEEFKGFLTTLGIPNAVAWLTAQLLPKQSELAKHAAEMAQEYPLQAMFKPQLLKDDRIVADIGDADGDPDGEAVYRTRQHVEFDQIWLRWGFDHLFETMGLTADQAVTFISGCPLYEERRLPLIRAGLQAHLDKDYVKSVHVLVPQIEKAVVNLLYHTGGATIKPHQSGRGVMQQKSINDALRHPDDRLANAKTVKALGPDLRVYLVAALSHPKGLNIRNEVCHGLWPVQNFTKAASERVLHVLFAVALLREAESPTESLPPAEPGSPPESLPRD